MDELTIDEERIHFEEEIPKRPNEGTLPLESKNEIITLETPENVQDVINSTPIIETQQEVDSNIQTVESQEDKTYVPPNDPNENENSKKKKKGFIPQWLTPILNIFFLSSAFLLIFSPYTTTQGYMTTIYNVYGYLILGVIYFIFGISNFFSPFFVQFLGTKLVLVISSFSYAIFVLSCGSGIWYVALIFAVFLGVGSSLLWTAQSEFISRLSNDNIGWYYGIFYGFFWSASVIGNLIGGALFNAHIGLWITFFILFIFSSIGSFLLIFLSNVKGPSINRVKIIKESFLIFYDKKIWFFILYSFYVGYNRAIYNGKIPEVVGKMLYPKYVGYTMSVLGVCEIIGSLFFGKGCDRFGMKWMTIGALLFSFFAVGSTLIMQYQMPYFFFCSSCIVGFADGGLTVCLFALLGSLFKDNRPSAFATRQLIDTVGTVFGLFLAFLGISLLNLQIISSSILFVATISFIFFDSFIQRVDKEEKIVS